MYFICLSTQNILYADLFKPEFTILIFINYKPRIAVTILYF